MELEVSLTTGDKFEPYRINDTHPAIEIIQLIALISAVIISVLLSGMIIRFIAKRPPPKRPIDKLNLVGLSFQAAAYLVIAIMILTILWTKQSIKDNFGQVGCAAFYFATPVFYGDGWLEALG